MPFRYRPFVIAFSILLPLAVAILYAAPKPRLDEGFDPYILPLINAVINASTFVLLIAGLIAVKSGNTALHRRLMSSAVILSALFLIIYVVYHAIAASTPFGGTGLIKAVYLIVLLSHIVLAAILAPLVLFTWIKALQGNFSGHKKLARYTLPVWLYVSLSGVCVYLMIAPYYPH